jgi:hypothetical protein
MKRLKACNRLQNSARIALQIRELKRAADLIRDANAIPTKSHLL